MDGYREGRKKTSSNVKFDSYFDLLTLLIEIYSLPNVILILKSILYPTEINKGDFKRKTLLFFPFCFLNLYIFHPSITTDLLKAPRSLRQPTGSLGCTVPSLGLVLSVD